MLNVRSLLSNRIFKESILLLSTSLIATGSGFLFWLVAARLFSTEAVGLGSALISSIGLITILSKLGFEITLNRYIPVAGKPMDFIIPALILPSGLAVIVSIVFILTIEFWSPELTKVLRNIHIAVTFVIVCLLNTVFALQREGIFVGLRAPGFSLVQTIIGVSRLVLLPFLLTLGAVGIFLSYGAAAGLAAIAGLFLTRLLINNPYEFSLNFNTLRTSIRYSFLNFLAQVSDDALGFVLPLLIISVLGPEANGLFYIPWQINMVFMAVPRWVSKSLLAEGAASEDESQNLFKSFALIWPVLLVGLGIVIVAGDSILSLLGDAYVTVKDLLLVLAVGSFPFSIIVVYATEKRINNELRKVIYIFLILTVGMLALSIHSIRQFGLIGVGYSWLFTNSVLSLIIMTKCFLKWVGIISDESTKIAHNSH